MKNTPEVIKGLSDKELLILYRSTRTATLYCGCEEFGTCTRCKLIIKIEKESLKPVKSECTKCGIILVRKDGRLQCSVCEDKGEKKDE